VDTSVLAPQHIYLHDEGQAVYYEFPHSLVHRIGTRPDGKVHFDDQMRVPRQEDLKGFDYVVVGDCRGIEGLAAPYDEEDTTDVMKLERMPDGVSILTFWFEHGNQDLYSGKQVEVQEFEE
jgi:hypothetical protein